jgi:hypothetical protein
MQRTNERAAEHAQTQMHLIVEARQKKNMHRGNYIALDAGVKSLAVPRGANG